MMEKHIIQIAPLAFMRGRTLSDAVVILVFSILLDRSPAMFLTGLGASAAIFMLVFPYKEKVISYLDVVSPEANAIGAVNVIKVEHRGEDVYLKGYKMCIRDRV